MSGPRSRIPLGEARLYLLATTRASRLPLVVAVEAAIRGGVDVVQLREKDMDDAQMTRVGRAVGAVCRAHRVTLLVNDRIDVAVAIEADGVHLGQDDAPVAAARAELPPGAIVGVSTHDEGELARALADGADYVGVGALFPTATKTTPVAVSGPAALAPLALRAESSGVPAFGIGGVSLETARSVVDAGFRRVAVCASILGSDDPEHAARALRRCLQAFDTHSTRESLRD